MGKIKLLPRELAEKIAAGEVIERPASVVKELVENAIDAGSTEIRVEIAEGGRALIRVTDNGCGIEPDELPLALERHATSKISALDDLWNLTTMGFRGEALPSIAAVSRFTIESRASEQQARRIYCEGAVLKTDEPRAPLFAGRGTCVAVENLFYNVPARLKFLKSKSSEAGQIRELLERLAFSRPGTRFAFFSDGRKSLELARCEGEKERAAQIFGASAGDLEEFSSTFENTRIHGCLDRNARMPNSKYVYLSVNGRMVRDKLLQQAVLVAMRPRMMEGEYPKIYLRADVPPDQVDVNVHPAKTEVRFERARDIFQIIQGALEKQGRAPAKPYYAFSDTDRPPAATAAAAPTPLFASDPAANRAFFRTKTLPEAPKAKTEPIQKLSSGAATDAALAPPAMNLETFSRLQYVGQIKNTYLLFQDESGMVVIDQHAAHERVQYEKVKKELLNGALRSQPLLIAAALKCPPEDVALALDYQPLFAKLGFEIEAFGEACVLIRTHPQILRQDHALDLARTLLEELKRSEGISADSIAEDPSRASPKLERLLATMACHSAIRAGQALSEREANGLMSTLDRTDFALNCPHGRPASIKLAFSDIENFFKRS